MSVRYESFQEKRIREHGFVLVVGGIRSDEQYHVILLKESMFA